MFSGIKNGKHCTNNINKLVLTFIALVPVFHCISATAGPVKEGWVIVIDPGHGGKDPGAVGSYSLEKTITLAVALKTGEYLKQNIKDVKVIYTRMSDLFLGLNERSEIANRNKADLFVSIHANAHRLKSTYGTETYVMGHSMDDQNLEVAMKENEVILLESDFSTKYEGFDPKSPESYIMFTLMQNAFSELSLSLAARVQTEYKSGTGRYDRGVKQAGFWVLWKTTMPSILTEIGFISNVNEEKYLNSKQGQDLIASAIFRACREYLEEISRKSEISTVKPEKTSTASIPANSISGQDGKTVFMIQISASSKKTEIKPGNFKNIKEITEIADGGRYRYTTGKFEDYSKAVEYRKQVELVYPDAFVIAVKNGKVLPLHQAIDNNKSKE